MAASDTLLSIRDLNVAFSSNGELTQVVHGLNLDCHAGETVAIVGESGSGKSVSTMAILGLLPKSSTTISGEITFMGRDILRLSDSEMRSLRGNEIAMIFQEPMTSLNPVLTVGKQISEALVAHRAMNWAAARREAIALLKRVRIPSPDQRIDDYPHNMSGGMRQRVMIAMALACKPRLLIADEPTTALDVTIQAEILDLIRVLQREENMGVIFITHDMGVVAQVADRTIVMKSGRVIEENTTTRIFHHPVQAYTKALLSAVPRLGEMGNLDRPIYPPMVDPKTGRFESFEDKIHPPINHDRAVLEVRHLVTRFALPRKMFQASAQSLHAVEDISFDIFGGETFSLVGESGCGKSTTGRSIARLTPALSGSIKIAGQEITSLPQHQFKALRKQVQMIFQDPFASLNPRKTVGSAIATPMTVHGICGSKEARERTRHLLEQVGLSADMEGRYPHEFSGGQRQRICIARALGLEPELIIADESVSALDVSVKAQIVNLLMELQAKLGISYLFISHDMAVVERISHRIAVMYLGQIIETGPRAAVFGNPQHPYTKRLLAAVPKPDPDHVRAARSDAPTELKSPIFPQGYAPPAMQYREISAGHFYAIDPA